MARPKRNFTRPETPEISTSLPDVTVKVADEIIPSVKEETIPFADEDIIVEKEAIIPEADVTPEMKQEEPINTPKTALPVVSFKERMEACSVFFGQNYFDEMVKKGCDYKAFGDWQKAYCGLLDRVFGIRNKEVLDVGSAYGALGHGFKQLGAKQVTCVDISKHVISAKVFDTLNYVFAPAQMMKAVNSASQDLIHASYLLNSIDQTDLDATFAEFKRVLAEKGKLFIIMNFGKDTVGNCYDNRHSKETIVKAAEKAGLKEVVDIAKRLRSVDDTRYEFISNYNWGIVCFE